RGRRRRQQPLRGRAALARGLRARAGRRRRRRMRRVAHWAASGVVALAAVVGLIALINSRDQGGLKPKAATAAELGKPYNGQPILSPADAQAVGRGNIL